MPATTNFTHKILLLALSLLLVTTVGRIISLYSAVHYYSEILAAAQIHEQVYIDDQAYQVLAGDVYRENEKVLGTTAWRALTLAYEVTLARRVPLFALAGTDPATLEAAIKGVATAEDKLAIAQKKTSNSEAIHSLYPLQFLLALADLEKKRQLLLEQPTETKAQQYERALPEVIEKKSTDLEHFKKAYIQTLGTEPLQLALFSGLLSAQSQLDTLGALIKDTDANKKVIATRLLCIKGIVANCTDRIQVIFPAATTTGLKNNLPIIREVKELWKEAYGSAYIESKKVTLSQSSCLAVLPGVHTFGVASETTGTSTIRSLIYLDDIFLIPTNLPNAPFLAYERDILGMQYTPSNSLMYYQCPQIGVDLGSALAVQQIATFAQNYPDLAPTERKVLLSDIASDTAAYAYLSAALQMAQGSGNMQQVHALEELALMANRSTVGLEDTLKAITRITNIDTENKVADTSARTEFFTHSAFPTFFRIGAQNPEVLSSLYVRNSATTELFLKKLLPYSVLRFEVPRSTIAHDLRSFLLMEGRIPSAIPSAIPTSTNKTSTP